MFARGATAQSLPNPEHTRHAPEPEASSLPGTLARAVGVIVALPMVATFVTLGITVLMVRGVADVGGHTLWRSGAR